MKLKTVFLCLCYCSVQLKTNKDYKYLTQFSAIIEVGFGGEGNRIVDMTTEEKKNSGSLTNFTTNYKVENQNGCKEHNITTDLTSSAPDNFGRLQ